MSYEQGYSGESASSGAVFSEAGEAVVSDSVKPVKCVCGHTATCFRDPDEDYYYVQCEYVMCRRSGPRHDAEKEAVPAWDIEMRALKHFDAFVEVAVATREMDREHQKADPMDMDAMDKWWQAQGRAGKLAHAALNEITDRMGGNPPL